MFRRRGFRYLVFFRLPASEEGILEMAGYLPRSLHDRHLQTTGRGLRLLVVGVVRPGSPPKLVWAKFEALPEGARLASGRTENNAPVQHTRTALLYPYEAPVTNTLTDQEAIQGKWEKSMLEDWREAPYHTLENSMNGGQDDS